jgi:hypothetical protein
VVGESDRADLRSLARRMVFAEDMMVENWACIGFGFGLCRVWDWDWSYSGFFCENFERVACGQTIEVFLLKINL